MGSQSGLPRRDGCGQPGFAPNGSIPLSAVCLIFDNKQMNLVMKATPGSFQNPGECVWHLAGAGDGDRTRDVQLGKLNVN